jgi:NADH:ubiquinone oxidoreductase subunit K
VFLATVLFLVGISGHFRIRQARIGLICGGGLLLAFAVIQLLGLPGPPA